MKPQEVRMDLINLEAGTRRRKLEPDVIKKYQALMEDGTEFPPVAIIRDGADYILVDGFHRFQCNENLEKRTIRAFVTEGTLRNAIWESFSANKLHGQPRAKGAAAIIIDAILCDSSWAKKTITAIAKHVGVTRGYVQQRQAKLKKTAKVDSEPENSEATVHSVQLPGDSTSSNSQNDSGEAEAEKPTLKRSGTIEVTTPTGKKTTKKNPADKMSSKTPKKTTKKKQQTKPEIVKDAVGKPIPKDLIGTYENRKMIEGWMKQLAAIRDDINKHISTRDPALTLLNTNSFKVNYANLRGTLKSALPHAVCVYCGSGKKTCEACGGFGFLNKISHSAAPKDMKK